MNKYILMGIVAISVVACSKSSNKGGGAAAPVRTAEHKPAECPAEIAGTYAADGNVQDLTEIVYENGTLIVRDPEAGDLPINGTVHVDKTDGSSNSVICKGGNLELVSVAKNGKKVEITISKNGKDLDVVPKANDQGYESTKLVRIKDAAVTNPAPAEETPGQNAGNGIPEMPAMPELPGQMEGMPKMPQMPVMPEMPKVSEEAANKCGGGTSYTYRYSVNGCDTGEQTFCSHQAYCNGLKDEALNKSCASARRLEDYKAAGCK